MCAFKNLKCQISVKILNCTDYRLIKPFLLPLFHMGKLDLYLLRHARTMEKESFQTDRERELSTLGLQNSTRMGIYLANKKTTFDYIVSSPAARAVKTAHLIAEQIKYDTEQVFQNEEIYEASVRTLLTVVNNLKDEWKKVLLVGHNPSISYLAEYITGAEIGNVTTCGLVHVSSKKAKWSDLAERTCDLKDYTYPDLLNFN